MSWSDYVRSVRSVRLVVDFGLERGLAPAKLLQGSGLIVAQLDDPAAELTAEQELKVTGNLLRLLKGEEHLGLKVGLRYHFSSYVFLGYGVISSATLEQEGDLSVLRYVESDLEPGFRQSARAIGLGQAGPPAPP
jgi:Arabinose-binding domain of AraC transcription regulator, N-term